MLAIAGRVGQGLGAAKSRARGGLRGGKIADRLAGLLDRVHLTFSAIGQFTGGCAHLTRAGIQFACRLCQRPKNHVEPAHRGIEISPDGIIFRRQFRIKMPGQISGGQSMQPFGHEGDHLLMPGVQFCLIFGADPRVFGADGQRLDLEFFDRAREITDLAAAIQTRHIQIETVLGKFEQHRAQPANAQGHGLEYRDGQTDDQQGRADRCPELALPDLLRLGLCPRRQGKRLVDHRRFDRIHAGLPGPVRRNPVIETERFPIARTKACPEDRIAAVLHRLPSGIVQETGRQIRLTGQPPRILQPDALKLDRRQELGIQNSVEGPFRQRSRPKSPLFCGPQPRL